MTTVPPPSTPPLQVAVAPPAATAVQILNPPSAVANLPPGTVLEAVVKPPPQTDAPPDTGKQQTVTLRTPQGDVTIKLPVRLPDNAKVALEVVRTAVAPRDAAAPTPATPQAQTPQAQTPQAQTPQAQTPQAQTSQSPQVTVRLVTIDNQPAVQVLAQLARQTVDTRAVAQQAAQQAPQQNQLLQIPPNDPQNPLLRAATLPPGNAWTVNGPVQLPSLGTVSALVVLAAPSAATPQQVLTALNTGNPANAAQPTPQPGALPGTPAAAPPAGAPLAQAATPALAPLATSTPFSFIGGSEVSLRVTGITLPGATPIIAPPTGPVATPTLAAPLASAPAAAPFVPQTGPIVTNAQGLPAAPPSPPQIVQTPPVLGTFTGTVVSQTPNGMPVIDTGTAQIQINVRANLPIGTHVTLEVTAQLEPRPGALPPPPVPAAAMPLSGPPGATVGWPTLTESLAVLQRSDPQAAQVLAQSIPDGGPKTAAAMIAFAQAMRSGDARQWPGDGALRALERAGPRGSHLASQLSDDVAALSGRARETGTEWRALPVPWNADGQIERIALITRREGDADDDTQKKTGGGGQRFIINLDLSRLGAMQLDGMFRKETKGFDLMIRTKDTLPDQIRKDLTGIFAASNAAMGLKGGLTFQVVKKFADPLAGALGTDKGGLWA